MTSLAELRKMDSDAIGAQAIIARCCKCPMNAVISAASQYGRGACNMFAICNLQNHRLKYADETIKRSVSIVDLADDPGPQPINLAVDFGERCTQPRLTTKQNK